MSPCSARPTTVWRSVLSLSLSQLSAWGALYYSFPVLLLPMEQALGRSRPEVSLALTIGLCTQAACTYGIGRWIDRHGGRLVMPAGLIAGAMVLLLWSHIDALWQFYVIWALIGVVSAAVLYEAAFATVTRQLGDGYRLGITVITLAGGFASTVFIPLLSWLVATWDWRTALIAVALLQVPIAALLLRELGPPDARLATHQEATMEDATGHTRVSGARRRVVLASLGTSYAAFALVYTSLLVHLLPMLQEAGLTPEAAVLVYTVIGPAQFLGRLVIFLLERRGRLSVSMAGILANMLPAASIALLLAVPGSVSIAVAAAAVFGAGMGIKTIVQATAAAELIGREAYGAVQGVLTIPALLAQAAAPFLSATVWSWAGGYPAVLVAALGCAALSLLGFATAVTVGNK